MSSGIWIRPASLKRIEEPWQPAPGFVEARPGVWEPEGHQPTAWELPAPEVKTPDDAIREWVRCSKSLSYFAFRHCFSIHVDDASRLPVWKKFPRYPYLKEFFTEVQEPANVHVEKSRQMLMSWAWMVVFLWDISFKKNWGNMVLSRRKTEVDDGGAVSSHDSLLGKVRHIWLALPQYLQAPLNFNYMVVRHIELNSYIRGEVGTVKAGRGRATKRALMDEAAWLDNSEAIFTGVRQAAKSGTILTSTPNGTSNVFARIRYDPHSTFKRLCTPAETPIWMGDYSFKPIADVRVGDTIIGFDDSGIGKIGVGRGRGQKRRTLMPAVVTAVHVISQQIVIKLVMRSGRTIRCTPEHRWLQVKHGKLMAGNLDYAPARIGSRISHCVEIPPPCPSEQQRLAAWLGGIYDGEGSSRTISQHQSANPEVYAAIEKALQTLGFPYARLFRKRALLPSGRNQLCGFYLNGDRSVMTRFVNWCQPVKSHQPKRGNQAWIFGSGFQSDEVVAIEPDGIEDVYALTTTTGNYVAWGYASSNSYHWVRHPEKAAQLFCSCGWKADETSDVMPGDQLAAHACANRFKKPAHGPEPRSPWYEHETRDMTPEQVASELDISYEKSRRGRVYGAFDSVRQTFNHQVLVDPATGKAIGERANSEDPDAYRRRYLRAALRPMRVTIVGWDFGVDDPTSLVLGQIDDESTMHVRWIDEFEENDQSWDFYHSFVNTAWAPIVKEVTGLDLLHYGDPSGKNRESDLKSWISNLRTREPRIVVMHDPKVGSLLDWLDFIHNRIRQQHFEVSTMCPGMLDALANYKYPTDKDGHPIPGQHLPVHDKFSHCMSAMLYAYRFRFSARLKSLDKSVVGNRQVLAVDGDRARRPDEEILIAEQKPQRGLRYFPR